MNKAIFFCALALLASCSGVKKTQEALNTGDYLTAMDKAIGNLAENKAKKGNQEYIVLLEDAFAKNTEREQQQIDFMLKDGNPAHLEKVYNKYVQLKAIQER